MRWAASDLNSTMLRRFFTHSVPALCASMGLAQHSHASTTASAKVKPRHVICLLGEWKSLDGVEKTVKTFGRGFSVDWEYSQVGADARMAQAFAASVDRVTPSFTEQDHARIQRHNTVAYVLSPPIERAEAMAVSAAALEITARLVQAGATAVKSESAGVAHGLDHWVQLARNRALNTALRQAWVRRPIADQDGTRYSCGMHLLGQPDMECTPGRPDLEAVRWMDALADKVLAGQALGKTFSVDGQAPAKPLQTLPCTRYEEDDFFFNPYGYVRIGA
jgi:hypothetical protein